MPNIGDNQNPKLRLPFILAAAFHVAILMALIIVAPVSSFRMPDSAPSKPVVQAAVVDAGEIAAQVQHIQMQEQRRQAEQQEKLKQIEAQAEAARQNKIAEEKRLEQIKEEQQQAQLHKQAAAQQAKLEEQKLVQLKAQQALAQAKALAVRKKQQEEIQAKEAQAKTLALKKQQDLTAKQNALQQQLLQQQIANEQEQFKSQQRMKGLVDQYRAQILIAIGKQWIIPDTTDPTISCVFSIDLTAGGTVSQVRLVKSSGNVGLDRAAEAAIYKASPLPVPKDTAAFDSFRHFTLKMTPQDVTH